MSEPSETLLRELVATMCQVRDQNAAILRLLQRGRGPRDSADARLLLVIAEVIGERAFTSEQLIEHAQADTTLAEALMAADIVEAHDAGTLFRRLRGTPVDGFVLERLDAYDRRGRVWRVRLCEGDPSHHRPG